MREFYSAGWFRNEDNAHFEWNVYVYNHIISIQTIMISI